MSNNAQSLIMQDVRMAIALLEQPDVAGIESVIFRRALQKGALLLAISALKRFIKLVVNSSDSGSLELSSLSQASAVLAQRHKESELLSFVHSLIHSDTVGGTPEHIGPNSAKLSFFVSIEDSFDKNVAEWRAMAELYTGRDLIATNAVSAPVHWTGVPEDACLEHLHVLQHALIDAFALWGEY